MAHFFNNLNQDNFSVNFGDNVVFTDSYNYNQNIVSNGAGYMFGYLNNFNSPVRMPDSVVNGSYMFAYSENFNSPVYIDKYNSKLNSMYIMFYGTNNFNHPINVPDNCYNIYSLFYYHPNYNSPVHIDPYNSRVETMGSAFYQCNEFSQDLNIPQSCMYWSDVLQGANNFAANLNIYTNNGKYGQPYNFDYAFQYWGFNGNVHFVNSYPTSGYDMFAYCNNFNRNVQLPNSFKNLEFAFLQCNQLNQNIRLPDNINAYGCFGYCNNLNRNIRIPTNSCYSYMFEFCEKLNQPIYVPCPRGENIDYQSYNSQGLFYFCNNLNANVRFEEGILDLTSTFSGCTNFNYPIALPSSVQKLQSTFSGCTNFNQNIQIPSGVSIMTSTFAWTNLDCDIQLPGGLISIGGCFSGCRSFNQNITIPSSVRDMSGCFSNCNNFDQNIQIPEGVELLHSAFAECNKFNQNIRIPSSVNDIYGMFRDCPNFNQNIYIPGGIRNIGSLFYNCPNLDQNIQIPVGVTDANGCFMSCLSYKAPVTVPSPCNNIYGMCVGSGVTDLTVLSSELFANNYNLHVISPTACTHEWDSEYNVNRSAPFDVSGYSVGSTIYKINVNRNCQLAYNQFYNSNSGNYEWRYTNAPAYFYSFAVYRFLGLDPGYIYYNNGGWSSRTVNQAVSYDDYVLYYASNIRFNPSQKASILLNDEATVYNYEKDPDYPAECYAFDFMDWFNTVEGVTPWYRIWLNLI